MSKKNNKNNEPPSLFDSFDLFADAGAATSATPPAESSTGRARSTSAPTDGGRGATALPEAAPAAASSAEPSAGRARAPRAPEPPPPPPPPPSAPQHVEPPPGLTGHGPLRELFDFNFRQYSAYVICSRAIPAVEDGLKPVQRRILHSLWEKDDGKYTKVANIGVKPMPDEKA